MALLAEMQMTFKVSIEAVLSVRQYHPRLTTCGDKRPAQSTYTRQVSVLAPQRGGCQLGYTRATAGVFVLAGDLARGQYRQNVSEGGCVYVDLLS